MSVYDMIEKYYTDKINTYGTTPQGVDWNGQESQILRFEQLSKIILDSNTFSLGDIGCGYGKYFEYLQNRYKSFHYKGYDLSQEMITKAKNIYTDSNGDFIHIQSNNEIQTSDYLVASGIFNVKNSFNEQEWTQYLLKTIHTMDKNAQKGFAFNVLTKYSDKECMKEYLYYADPLFLFDYCKQNFSKDVALLHDYGLYEFTILVRKGQ